VGSVAAIPHEGGNASILAPAQRHPTELGLTDDAIYWISDWQIWRLAK
jgi:hypothetical protein